MKKLFVISVLIFTTILLHGFTSSDNDIVILLTLKPTKTELLAAKELRRYIYLRSGILAEIRPTDAIPLDHVRYIAILSKDFSILKLTRDEDLYFESSKLKSQEYIIKTVTMHNNKFCIIYGGDDIGALYGAYRFAEFNGIRFYLHGDVIPDEKADILLPNEQITGKPLFNLRGIQPFHDFPQGPDWWNTDDYKAVIAQLPKMGMNFIGFHTYPEEVFAGWDKAEPNVWIGTKDQINDDGSVKSAYPVLHANTGDWTWDHNKKKTSKFSFGASQLFETDYYGADYMMNISEWPHTEAENIDIFNKVGKMYNNSFSFAHKLGIKTCMGTEIPLTIPEKVRKKLESSGIKADSDTAKIKLYEGMFSRIMKTYPLDYYWFWTNEDWTWKGEKPGEVEKNEKDIELAIQAKKNINAPFTLATCGWVLGPSRDRTEFDKLFPKDMPFSCINREVGFTPIDKGFNALKDRPKWAIPWMEDDPALVSPQLWVGRTRRDAYDAYRYGCTGFMGIHWRTEPLGPAFSALAKATWEMGEWKNKLDTTKRDLPVDDFYNDWAEIQFGKNVAPEIAAIFVSIDGGPLLKPAKKPIRIANLYRASDWMGKGPGGLKPNKKPWDEVKSNFSYLEKLSRIKEKLIGEGNKQRFDYWYNLLLYNYSMAETGCILGQIDTLIKLVKLEKSVDGMKKIAQEKVLPLKENVIQKWEEMVTQLLETVNTPGDMGTVANLEQHSLSNLQSLSKYDSLLTYILGKPVTTNLSSRYTGDSRLIVPTKRTLLEANENLDIKAIVLSQNLVKSVDVYWRKIGDKTYQKFALKHIARGVYKGSLEQKSIAGEDFEYYIEAKPGAEILHYPATAPEQNQTVVVMN